MFNQAEKYSDGNVVLLQRLCFQNSVSNVDSVDERLAEAVRKVWRSLCDRFVSKRRTRGQTGPGEKKPVTSHVLQGEGLPRALRHVLWTTKGASKN